MFSIGDDFKMKSIVTRGSGAEGRKRNADPP
jgi:hypothetical protein